MLMSGKGFSLSQLLRKKHREQSRIMLVDKDSHSVLSHTICRSLVMLTIHHTGCRSIRVAQ